MEGKKVEEYNDVEEANQVDVLSRDIDAKLDLQKLNETENHYISDSEDNEDISGEKCTLGCEKERKKERKTS